MNDQTDFRDPRWNDEQTALTEHAADYHVCCHDCRFETVVHNRAAADSARAQHVFKTEHNAEHARIDR